MSTKQNYRSHVGMAYAKNGYRLFCFQLLGEDDKAHAVVDFTNGHIERILTTKALDNRQAAIIRLADAHRRAVGC